MKFELLAPAGNLMKMKTALAHGADAVYAGIPDFSLRVRINDFDFEKLKEATEYCHGLQKKIYITINIFAHNRHLKKLPDYLTKLKKIKVDALIVSDPGVLRLVKKHWPEAEIHLSTQANCTNWQAVKFWQEQGVRRIILGREVTLAEIKEIKKRVPEMELEYFVHGAMCMSYSGRCFLSKYYIDRSGNLGDCIQPCRFNYYLVEEKRLNQPLELVEEEHGSYILNSKDLCLFAYLDELKKAGITSFKIEGRAKSVYYQAIVAGIYAKKLKEKKIDNDFLQKELETKISNRGYTTGFLLGYEEMMRAEGQTIDATHQKIDWEFCGQVVSQENNFIKILVHNTIKQGDIIEIINPFYEVRKIKIKKMFNEKKEQIEQTHGGAGKMVLIEVDFQVNEYSVLRRKI